VAFPATRLRRLRRTPVLRDMVRETDLGPEHLVLPLFVEAGLDGRGGREPISAMPGVDRLSIDALVEEAGAAHEAGVPAVLLFGIPDAKDAEGTGAYDDEGIVQLAVRALKAAHPGLVVMTDVCLCEYTDHGHCGLLREDGSVDNDSSVELIARTALSHARAGADVVAPSDMMDGRVGAIRTELDAEGLADAAILAYSAKFASAFYGPFREAAGSTPAFGDRRAYQMDPANGREGLREALLDADEGADALMVKPALPYLDVLAQIRRHTLLPLAAYHVSGEYAMLKLAAAAGALDERAAALEALTSIRRAGADIVITYFAKDAATWLR
jgi:porphobilinogen synthase